MTNKDLTIVITTFRSEDKIENCLNSIGQNIKVVLVENSNNKRFKNYIETKFINVECLLAMDNLGYGKANNIGLKKVKTKYALILNPDTILQKNALVNFFAFLDRKIDFAILGPDQSEKEIPENSSYKDFKLVEVDEIKGFAIFLNMEKFSDIGFFDENFFLYLEEIDLCRRIKDLKEKIYVNSNIRIFHYGGKSVNKNLTDSIELTRNWHWMWSLFYFNKKYYGYFHALVTVSPRFISALFKTLFYAFILKKKKRNIYIKRLSGIANSVLGKNSWYRPSLD